MTPLLNDKRIGWAIHGRTSERKKASRIAQHLRRANKTLKSKQFSALIWNVFADKRSNMGDTTETLEEGKKKPTIR